MKGKVNLESFMFTMHRLSELQPGLEALEGGLSLVRRALSSFGVFIYAQKVLTNRSELILRAERDQG